MADRAGRVALPPWYSSPGRIVCQPASSPAVSALGTARLPRYRALVFLALCCSQGRLLLSVSATVRDLSSRLGRLGRARLAGGDDDGRWASEDAISLSE